MSKISLTKRLKYGFKNLIFNIVYYCWDKPKDWYYNVKWLFNNIIRFRKHLWDYRTWDFYYSANLFADSLSWLANDIENGNEEEVSRTKKTKAIRELSSLIKHTVDGTEFGCDAEFFDDCSKMTISFDEYNKEYKKRRKEVLDRIYRIIYGQEEDSTNEVVENKEIPNDGWYKDWVKNFDGTGYERWWE